MATTNQNVTADQLISATVKYSNKDDASRGYDISANVRIEYGNVVRFESGEVRKSSESPENMEGGNIASFDSNGQKQLNLYIHNADETESQAILTAIHAFMTDVKANVNSNPVTA